MGTSESREEENKEVIRELNRRLNDHDLSVVDELCSEEFTPGMGRVGSDAPVVGREGIKSLYQEYFDAFPDITARIDAIVAEDDQVAVFYTFSGTHEGAFRSIEPTGNDVSFSTTSHYTLEDGKIVAGKGQAGLMELVDQLGVEIPLKA